MSALKRSESSSKERGIKQVEIFFPDWDLPGDNLSRTSIRKDTHKTKNEAILRSGAWRLRPWRSADLRVGCQEPFFNETFF